MSYRIALCDDDLTQAQSLNRQVAAWARQTSAQCSVEIVPSGEALLFARETAGDWDILLLDVEMPGMTGLDLARRLRAEGCRSDAAAGEAVHRQTARGRNCRHRP